MINLKRSKKEGERPALAQFFLSVVSSYWSAFSSCTALLPLTPAAAPWEEPPAELEGLFVFLFQRYPGVPEARFRSPKEHIAEGTHREGGQGKETEHF